MVGFLPGRSPGNGLALTRALQVAEVALNVPAFEYDPAVAAKASNPNRRRKWLIPVVLAAQVRVAEQHALHTASCATIPEPAAT